MQLNPGNSWAYFASTNYNLAKYTLAGIENQPGLKISEKNISSFCPFLVQKCMILFREKKSCIQKKEKDSQPVWRCINWHEFNNSGWFIKDYMVINYQIKLFFSSRLPINIISTG